MSFSDAYEKLLVPEKVEDYIEKTYENKIISEKTSTDITVSMTDGFLFSGNLKTDSMYDTVSWNAEIGFGLIGGAYIPDAKSTINTTLSWKVQTTGEKLYLYIDSFDLKPQGTGQQDSLWLGLISPIVNSISKQRIDFSPENNTGIDMLSGVSIAPYGANIKQFFIATQHALKTYPLFQEAAKTQIDSKLAYQIAWNPVGVSGFIHEILKSAQNIGGNIEISTGDITKAIEDVLKTELSGYLIIYSENNVALHIDSLASQDAWTLSLNISTKTGATFQLLSTQGSLVFTGEAGRQNKNNTITISVPENNIQISIQIPDDRESLSATINGSWFSAQINSHMEIKPIDTYAPSVIGETKSIQTIINGLMWLFWRTIDTWDNTNTIEEIQQAPTEITE